MTSTMPAPPAPKGARERFSLNVSTNVAYIVGSAALALWYVPFLIDHLGVAGYGVIALVNSLVLYLAVVTDALDQSIGRHLTIDLRTGDDKAAGRTFSTAFAAAAAAVAVLLVPLAFATWWFPRVFDVPPGQEQAARVLVACILVLVVLELLGLPYKVPMFALHRFDLRNAVRGSDLVVRTSVAVLLVLLLQPSVWQVGIGYAVGGAVALGGAVWTCRRLAPALRFASSDIDRSRLRDMLSFGGWAMVNRAGMLLFLSVDLVIINIALGPEATGVYGTLLLFPVLVRSGTDAVASLLAPAVVNRFADGDLAGVRELARSSVRLLSLGLALPVGLLCGLAAPFLSLWLGPTFSSHALLLGLLVAHLTVNMATLPLSYVLNACNRVRPQAIGTVVLGGLNVLLSVLFAIGLGWGLEGVALATALAFTLRSAGLVSVLAARAVDDHTWVYLPDLLRSAGLAALVAAAALVLSDTWTDPSWLGLVGQGLLVSLLYAGATWLCVLKADERSLVRELLVRRHAG